MSYMLVSNEKVIAEEWKKYAGYTVRPLPSIRTQYDLASRLNFICYDTNSYAMGWQKTIEQLGINKLAQFKPSFDFVSTFGRCNSKFYCPPQNTFECLLNNYFHIEEVFYPHEHEYCKFEPVYVLRKK